MICGLASGSLGEERAALRRLATIVLKDRGSSRAASSPSQSSSRPSVSQTWELAVMSALRPGRPLSQHEICNGQLRLHHHERWMASYWRLEGATRTGSPRRPRHGRTCGRHQFPAPSIKAGLETLGFEAGAPRPPLRSPGDAEVK